MVTASIDDDWTIIYGFGNNFITWDHATISSYYHSFQRWTWSFACLVTVPLKLMHHYDYRRFHHSLKRRARCFASIETVYWKLVHYYNHCRAFEPYAHPSPFASSAHADFCYAEIILSWHMAIDSKCNKQGNRKVLIVVVCLQETKYERNQKDRHYTFMITLYTVNRMIVCSRDQSSHY